ncbi:helix-turn-helix transcriptional regulator [Bacillus sp. ISL-26]|uniref:helix-turn-helix transcriptional regulator n=1 Tax=Bacillus sp. ISL-26 TaxID=2819119 RepID=UPI001BE9AE7C|nr:helix-turn-helix transcriptional regulator [Bacillus sp. ISL-26]MBT2634584.1 helix-turn-helix transcriptional regulator [Bacillus sp. ISL-26]
MDKAKSRHVLTSLRKKEGSQSLVAKKLGISRQYLSAMENGERNPGVKLMVKMSNHFNEKSESLFPDLFFEDDCHEMRQKSNTA